MKTKKREYNVSLKVTLQRVKDLNDSYCSKMTKLMNNINLKGITTLSGNTDQTNTVKRGRGRPKKEKTVISSLNTINTNEKNTMQNIGKSIFLDVLKQAKRPLTTSEITKRAKQLNKPLIQQYGLRGKKLYNLMQQAAFYLSKENEIKRNPVDKKSFEYGLKEWATTQIMKSA